MSIFGQLGVFYASVEQEFIGPTQSVLDDLFEFFAFGIEWYPLGPTIIPVSQSLQIVDKLIERKKLVARPHDVRLIHLDKRLDPFTFYHYPSGCGSERVSYVEQSFRYRVHIPLLCHVGEHLANIRRIMLNVKGDWHLAQFESCLPFPFIGRIDRRRPKVSDCPPSMLTIQYFEMSSAPGDDPQDPHNGNSIWILAGEWLEVDPFLGSANRHRTENPFISQAQVFFNTFGMLRRKSTIVVTDYVNFNLFRHHIVELFDAQRELIYGSLPLHEHLCRGFEYRGSTILL